MALKPGNCDGQTDISNSMCTPGEMGGFVSFVLPEDPETPVAMGMDSPSNLVGYVDEADILCVAGMLLNNVSATDPCKCPPNCQDTCTVPVGSAVALVLDGYRETNFLADDVLAAGPQAVAYQKAYVTDGGKLTLVPNDFCIGKFTSDVDKDGFVGLNFDVRNQHVHA